MHHMLLKHCSSYQSSVASRQLDDYTLCRTRSLRADHERDTAMDMKNNFVHAIEALVLICVCLRSVQRQKNVLPRRAHRETLPKGGFLPLFFPRRSPRTRFEQARLFPCSLSETVVG